MTLSYNIALKIVSLEIPLEELKTMNADAKAAIKADFWEMVKTAKEQINLVKEHLG